MPVSRFLSPAAVGQYKLGKQPARLDPRTFQIANYLLPDLPAPKSHATWLGRMRTWSMLGNDRVGDCVFASQGHQTQAWTRAADGAERTIRVTEADTLAAYSGATGYDPARPETDRGSVMLDSMNYWRQIGIAGHKILAYAALEPRNLDHAKIALQLFGGVQLGISLPLTAQTQRVWSVPPGGLADPRAAPGSWGGHAVTAISFSFQGVSVISWGKIQHMTWGFFSAYVDESYAILSDDWLADNGIAPNHFDLASLREDLEAL